MRRHNYKYLPNEVIERIITGDPEAVTALVAWYMPYIKKLSQGNKDIEDRVTAKLIRATMQFRLDYER